MAMKPCKQATVDNIQLTDGLPDQMAHTKTIIRAKIEHPFRMIKR